MNVASASLRGLVSKEVKALFTSTIAYTVVAVFLVLMSYTFTTTLVVTQTASLVHIFYQSALLMLLLVPVLTMRLFAEERRNGTLELLLASPIREFEVVLAKFVATMLLILAMLGLSLCYPLTLAIFGTPEWGPIYSGYLGLTLFAAALTALGLGISALSSNQVVAAVLSIGLFFFLWMIDQLAAFVPAPLDEVATDLSLSARLAPFLTGAMYFADLGYFLSLTLFGLLFSVRALARR
jgi:gliding motility-associated transport system permease protein